MNAKRKHLSNPFSTGGGGVVFETHIQAAFTVLMLTGGFVPCLSTTLPIRKIKLQGKYAGYETDDFIAFTGDQNSKSELKLLAQIKHSISFTKQNKTFGEVIHAAWNDFCNRQLFDPAKDAIALITGPLSATDIKDVRTILEWARHSENATDYITKIDKANFSSVQKKNKLQVFRYHLDIAKGSPLTDDELWGFMKSFHLLGSDLDIKAGGTLSLLQSLIGQYSVEDVQQLWCQIVNEVQYTNQNAGTLEINAMSTTVRDVFKERITRTIPAEYVEKISPPAKFSLADGQNLSELAIALLLGAWNESSSGDKAVVEALSGSAYAVWIGKMREVFLQSASPLKQRNGKWEISNRLDLWNALGPRIFDDILDRFKDLVVKVLKEPDPRFELQPEDRFAAGMYGKNLSHSRALRKGLSDALALLGNYPKALTSCALNKAEATAVLAVREILANADWVQWASLNELLPFLAEASPEEFLDAVEEALNSSPCPFDAIFAQEGSGITGSNYTTGLLWALETLAWDEAFLARVVVILGELGARDPGGSWANRPANSLTTILLPWLPQTCAPIAKRRAAVVTLLGELPDVGWKLLLSLLPESHSVSSHTRKPAWRKTISDDWKESVTSREYWEQIAVYAELAINIAKTDLKKLSDIIGLLENLPPGTREQLLAHLSSASVTTISEADRLILWNELMDLVHKHKKFANAQWAMKPEQVDIIASVAERLAPGAPIFRYQRLFSDRDFDLFDEKGNYEEQQKKLDESRQKAVAEIATTGGIQSVLTFATSVQSPWRVGIAFGFVAGSDFDVTILPSLLDTAQKALAQFAGGFIWGRFHHQGWSWVEQIDTDQWKPEQIGQFLAYLPFVPEVWKRSTRLLKDDESPYWTKTNVNPYKRETEGFELAIDQLIKYGRPYAALQCLAWMHLNKQAFDTARAARALLAALTSSENIPLIDSYEVAEVIKALQDNPDTNPDDLFRVEWAYLPLLDKHHRASPKLLERRLANEPEFFCEVIRLVFRSKNTERPAKEPTEQEKNIATNAYRLLSEWRTPPGCREDGSYDAGALGLWLKAVKKECSETGHLEVAMEIVGQVLIHTPPDPNGLWIHHSAAMALNAKDSEDMRNGFSAGLFNSRGAFWIDPTGKPEMELAKKYKQQAEELENVGYQRLAATMRRMSDEHVRGAERIVSEHKKEDG